MLLSEEEHAAVAEIDVDVSRVSWDTMDTIMEANTGLTVWETNRVGMESLYFNKHDGVFYHFHGDTNALFVQVRSGHYNADGTITLYYVRSGSEKWINEAAEEFAVVLRPDNRRYWFVSNRKLEGSSLSETLQAQQEETSPYKLMAVSHEDYNAVFDNNGYQYHFKLDMDTANLFLLFGEKVERSNSTGKWTVTPVYASNGAKEELLGELRGFVFDVTSDALVGPNSASGNRFCGKIGAVTDSSVEIYQAEALDMDTYTEFVNVSENAETYTLAEDVEFVMLDANFRNVSTTYERFVEKVGSSGEIYYYFVEKDGEIVQVWQPFIP